MRVACWLCFLCVGYGAVPGLEDAQEVVYQETATRPLSLYLFAPEAGKSVSSPAILFFFGGGWNGGSVLQFAQQARYFRARGYVTVLADYRVRGRDGTSPFEAVADAKSAVRWMRANAAKWKVDPHRIAAAGGSAGGHIAGGAAILPEKDAASRPDALLLFNPVADTTETGYGAKFIGARAKELSLTAQVGPGLPPTIVFHGTADRTVPFANVVEFQRAITAAGNVCELVPFEGEDHGFFNSPAFRPKNAAATYEAILERSAKFLSEHLK